MRLNIPVRCSACHVTTKRQPAGDVCHSCSRGVMKTLDNPVVELDSLRPHIRLSTENHEHIIPVTFFEKVINGKRSLKELTDFDEIVPVIVGEWLALKINEMESGNV